MSYDFREMAAAAGARQGPSPLRWIRRLVVIGFGVVQLILVARIALDLGYLPDVVPANLVLAWSDAVAAPVEKLAAAVMGPGALAFGTGSGLNPAMVAALAGWSIVEGVVLGFLGRLR